MILFFLLLGVLIIIGLISYILLLSNIKVKITKLHIRKYEKVFELELISKIGIYLFNKIKLIEITINDEKIKELLNSKKIDITKMKYNKQINKEIFEILKKVKIQIEELKIKGIIGTENAAFTAILIGILNAVIPLLIHNKISKEDYKNNLEAIYINQNVVNLEINCIITFKIVHIINILIYLKKGRVNQYERTSNRRAYAYSHE